MKINETYRKSIEACTFDGKPCVLNQIADVFFINFELSEYVRQIFFIPHEDALFISEEHQIDDWYKSVDVIVEPHHNRWIDIVDKLTGYEEKCQFAYIQWTSRGYPTFRTRDIQPNDVGEAFQELIGLCRFAIAEMSENINKVRKEKGYATI